MSGILSGLLGGFANINHADPAGGSNPMTLLWQQYLLNQQRQRMQEVPPGQPGAALGVDPNAPQGMPALRAWLQSLHDDTDSFSDDTYAHIRDAMVLAGSGSDPQALQAALRKQTPPCRRTCRPVLVMARTTMRRRPQWQC